jgi:hypothetical protein
MTTIRIAPTIATPVRSMRRNGTRPAAIAAYDAMKMRAVMV